MTKLLVSVRNAAEAALALDGGADLLDVKEPAQGPLGAADPETLRAVVERVAGRAPISAALGELAECNTLDAALAGRVDYAKFGLAGCRMLRDWIARWETALAGLPPGVVPVAVAYADWQAAQAPKPIEVLAHARRLGCGAVLLDTFDKSGGTLVEHLSGAELHGVFAAARREGLLCVAAGRLDAAAIQTILPLEPDYVGVRGAACRGDRRGQIEVRRVQALANLVHGRGAATVG